MRLNHTKVNIFKVSHSLDNYTVLQNVTNYLDTFPLFFPVNLIQITVLTSKKFHHVIKLI